MLGLEVLVVILLLWGKGLFEKKVNFVEVDLRDKEREISFFFELYLKLVLFLGF